MRHFCAQALRKVLLDNRIFTLQINRWTSNYLLPPKVFANFVLGLIYRLFPNCKLFLIHPVYKHVLCSITVCSMLSPQATDEGTMSHNLFLQSFSLLAAKDLLLRKAMLVDLKFPYLSQYHINSENWSSIRNFQMSHTRNSFAIYCF